VRIAAIIIGLVIIFGVLLDAFETVVLPRRVSRRLRLVRFIVAPAWIFYSRWLRKKPTGGRRETYLSYFGPGVSIMLLVVWAGGLILGFSIILWGLGSGLSTLVGTPSFADDLYVSATTFFTLGTGDATARSTGVRVVTTLEAGIGLGFLALVISYLPVLYQTFSGREVLITQLDAWAGSPPSAVEFLRRMGAADHLSALDPFLEKCEQWSAELLNSHIAYPVLCYFRSEHDNQSWLASLATILDACALIIAGVDGIRIRNAELTFAIARHAVVDLSQILNRVPRRFDSDRLPPADVARIREILTGARIKLHEGQRIESRLAELREMYEPYLHSLADYLVMPLPLWIPPRDLRDNWQRSKWKTPAQFH